MVRAELEALATEVAATKITRERARGAGGGGAALREADAGAARARAAADADRSLMGDWVRANHALPRRHLPRRRRAARRAAGEERAPHVLRPAVWAPGDYETRRGSTCGTRSSIARSARRSRAGTAAGARALAREHVHALVRAARARARALLERRTVTRPGGVEPSHARGRRLALRARRPPRAGRPAEADRRGGSAPRRRRTPRRTRLGGDRRRAPSTVRWPQSSCGSCPQAGPPGERPARSCSSWMSMPCFVKAARSPSTRKRGPRSAASALIQRWERTPDSCSSAMKSSSSTTAPSRRVSTSA